MQYDMLWFTSCQDALMHVYIYIVMYIYIYIYLYTPSRRRLGPLQGLTCTGEYQEEANGGDNPKRCPMRCRMQSPKKRRRQIRMQTWKRRWPRQHQRGPGHGSVNLQAVGRREAWQLFKSIFVFCELHCSIQILGGRRQYL